MVEKTPFQLRNRRDWPLRGDRYHPAEPPRGLVFVVHGFKGFKDWGHFPYVCQRLCEAGFAVVHGFDSEFEVGQLLREERGKPAFIFDDQDARSLVRVAAVRHMAIFSEAGPWRN